MHFGSLKTPEMLRERNERDRGKGKPACKVVRREICSLVSKGKLHLNSHICIYI